MLTLTSLREMKVSRDSVQLRLLRCQQQNVDVSRDTAAKNVLCGSWAGLSPCSMARNRKYLWALVVDGGGALRRRHPTSSTEAN